MVQTKIHKDMMTKIYKNLALLMLSAMVLVSCEDEIIKNGGSGADMNRIQLSGEIEQVAVTRVNDNGFCDGDVMGVYVVDYQGNNPGVLQSSGNRGDNVRHTFDEAAYKWSSAYDLFWKDGKTHIDVYGYYPFGSPTDVTAYELSLIHI